MFYAHFVLAKKGPLAKIWLAAHWDKKLTKAHVFETNIEKSVDGILKPKVKMALRTSGHLLLGVVRIYSRKAKYLLQDCNEAFVKIKMAFRPGMVDLPEEHREAAMNAITLPEVFHDFDTAMPELNEVDIEAQFSLNQSRAEEITMREDYGSLNLVTHDDGFGDMGFDTDNPDIMREAIGNDGGLEQSNLVFAEGSSLELGGKEPQAGTSAGPTLPEQRMEADPHTHMDDGFGESIGDVPDFGQEAGGLFEGDLFESVGGGERGGSLAAGGDAESDGEGHYLEGGASPDRHSWPPSPPPPALPPAMPPPAPPPAPPTPLPMEVEEGVEGAETAGAGSEAGPGVGPGAAPPPQEEPAPADHTTLLHNDEESFALAPVDATVLKGITKTKRKRKLIVDEVKNISGEEMKNQLSNTSDIVTTLDLAPPTRRLMHWKETGGVEKLFTLPARPIPSRVLFKKYQRNMTLPTAEEPEAARAASPAAAEPSAAATTAATAAGAKRHHRKRRIDDSLVAEPTPPVAELEPPTPMPIEYEPSVAAEPERPPPTPAPEDVEPPSTPGMLSTLGPPLTPGTLGPLTPGTLGPLTPGTLLQELQPGDLTPGMTPGGMTPGLGLDSSLAHGLTPGGLDHGGMTPGGLTLQHSGLTPGGLTHGGITPAGLTHGGITPAGLAHGGMTPAGLTHGGMTPAGLTHGGMTPAGLPHGGMTPAGLGHGGMTPGGMTPAGLGHGGMTPAGLTHGDMTPAGLTHGGMTPAGLTHGGMTPAGLGHGGMTPAGLGHGGMTPAGLGHGGMTPAGLGHGGMTPTGLSHGSQHPALLHGGERAPMLAAASNVEPLLHGLTDQYRENMQMTNLGYEEHQGHQSPNHDYDLPPTPEQMEGVNGEREAGETEEQFEERVLNRRAAQLFAALRPRLHAHSELSFLDLAPPHNNRKQVAQKFYSLLVLKKHQVLKLEQNESYGPITIRRGEQFETNAI